MTIPYRELRKLFQARFLESEELAAGSGYNTNIAQILGIVATPGFLVSLMWLPRLMNLAMKSGPDGMWPLREYRLFFAAFSFAATGFATVFEWDTLFPDRRDFLILMPFPIRMRDVFKAKLVSLLMFVAVVATAVNAGSLVLMPLFSTMIPELGVGGIATLFLAHAASCGLAAAFAFFSIAAVQGVLINLLTPRAFRRFSPWLQMFGMAATVMSLLLYPVYSNMRTIAATHPAWLQYFPPYWFNAIQEMFSPRADPMFRELGWHGIKATGWAVAVFGAAWAAGFARHYRRTLEAEDVGTHRPSGVLNVGLGWIHSPQERAIFCFSGALLARSIKHRLLLSVYVSVGISLGFLVMVVIRNGRILISQEGLRTFPILMTFFVLSGMRGVFQFPAELQSNWVFQITEAGWGRAARNATRKRALMSGLLLPLILFLPFEMWQWGAAMGMLHIAFQAIAGALLIEVLFWQFDKVPFTCSYFPGKVNLTILAGIYLYGFTNYSFAMTDLEASLEGKPVRTGVCSAAGMLALVLLWRRKSKDRSVVFEAGEPTIRMLNLN